MFTIPTPSGPITLDGLQDFVTVRAGGYFFMPSYSPLLYLWDRSRSEAGLPLLSVDGASRVAERPKGLHGR